MCLLSCARNYLGVIFFIFNFVTISSSLGSHSESLKENESCNFALNSGDIIDLSPLLNSNQPLIASTVASLYIYHPCTDVPLESSVNNECSKSYGLCYFVPLKPSDVPVDFNNTINNKTQGNFTLLARNADAVFRENRLKQPEIVYKHTNNKSNTVTTYVRLECDENIRNYELKISETNSQLEHILTLSSKYVCVEAPHYMSGGTVFFIILIVFIALYFVGGILVLKFIRGATGIEMIPNHEFWCNLPQLARDGFKYLTTCGRSTPDSYEKI